MRGRLQTVLLVLVLLSVGFLLGSFWLEWRHPRLAESTAPGEGAGPPTSLPDGFESRVRVEILNGMGEPDAARRAANRLRRMGFDVVYFGNADGFGHARTKVLARALDPAGARAVAESLGIERVAERPDTALYLDATVVLGADWHELTARLDSSRRAEVEGGAVPERLRRLLERVTGRSGG